MTELGWFEPHRFIKQLMLGRIGKMILAADHMRDLHQRIIHANHEVEGRAPIRTLNHKITDHLIQIKRNFAPNQSLAGDFIYLLKLMQPCEQSESDWWLT